MRKEVIHMNALVAYFSATGTTAKAAKALAKAVGGELYEIKPAIPYTCLLYTSGQGRENSDGDQRCCGGDAGNLLLC